MKLVTLAAAGFAVLGASPALAQYGPYGPIMRPMMPIAGMPGGGVVAMVREMGLDPIGAPARSGNFFIQRAADYYGRPMRVVVDARRAQVVSVEALNTMGPLHAGPYAAAYPRYAPAIYRRAAYPGYGAPDGEDLDGMAMTLPPQVTPKQGTKSAAVSPATPPVPRRRPATAPQAAGGATEPVRSTPGVAAAPHSVALPAPAAEAKPSAPAVPAATAMPPVAPLE